MSNINRNAALTVTESIGLLEFLLGQFPDKSRSSVKSLLSHKDIFVDGKSVSKFDYALSPGQTVEIRRQPANIMKKNMPLEILFEDNDLIVINKPAGLLTISTDAEKENTAYHILTDYVRQNHRQGRIFIVHRLDKDTSGIVIFAKNEKIKNALQDNWADLVSERVYAAVVEGHLTEKNGEIRSWLKETKTMVVYSSQKNGDGLEAITEYSVIAENPDFSLLDVRLKTGRKNQIRVHMKDIGHSVAGDKKYGALTDPMKRLGLHAYKLTVVHPFTHKPMCYQTPLPSAFSRLFKQS